MMSRFLKRDIKIFLNFRDCLQIIGHLEPLHILNDPGQFVILIKVE